MLDLLARNIRLSLTIFLLIGFSTLLIATIIYNFNANNSIIFTIGISISTSGLATSLVQIIEQIVEKIENFSNQNRFLTLFGCNDKTKGDGSIAIIIPAFILEQNNSQQPGRTIKSEAQKLVSHNESNAAIKNDVTAASYFISTFSRLGLSVPQIKWDEEVKRYQNDKIKTYIIIGLSNEVISLLDYSTEKYFSIEPTFNNERFSGILIKVASFDNRNQLIDKSRWENKAILFNPETYDPIDNLDYALFAKFSLDKKVFIVCGGGTEWGTREIGTYMSDNGWNDVYSVLKSEKGSKITANEAFAVVFQIPLNSKSEQKLSIVHKCIRKKKLNN